MWRTRQRNPEESVQEWLMSDHDRANSRFGLPGSQVQCSVILDKEFDARIPPPLPSWFTSNFTLGPKSPLQINAPMQQVWKEILNFNSYREYNPFHRHVEIQENTKTGVKYVAMRVNLFAPTRDLLLPAEGYRFLQPERIFYVDEREDCCILLYGLHGGLVPTVRGQIVVKTSDKTCDYYSYDHFGGSASIVVKLLLASRIQHGFELAADALKLRCEQQSSKL